MCFSISLLFLLHWTNILLLFLPSCGWFLICDFFDQQWIIILSRMQKILAEKNTESWNYYHYTSQTNNYYSASWFSLFFLPLEFLFSSSSMPYCCADLVSSEWVPWLLQITNAHWGQSDSQHLITSIKWCQMW